MKIKLAQILILLPVLVGCASLPVPSATLAELRTAMPAGTETLAIPDGFEKGPIFVNQADLLIMESYPVQVRLNIQGDMPTPCHRFRADVVQPDAQNQIQVMAYSFSNPEMMCSQVLQPFEENVLIPMDGSADGTYTVWLNGELVGEFNYPG